MSRRIYLMEPNRNQKTRNQKNYYKTKQPLYEQKYEIASLKRTIKKLGKENKILKENSQKRIDERLKSEEEKTKQLEYTVEKLKSNLEVKKKENQDKTKRIKEFEERISELENSNQKNSGNNVSSVIKKDLQKIFKNNRVKIRDNIKKLIQETDYLPQEISEIIYKFYNYNVNIFHVKWMSYLESLNFQEIPKICQFGFLQKNFLQWYMECHDELYLKEETKTKIILDFLVLQKIKPIEQIYNEMKDNFGSEFLSNYFNPKEISFTKYLLWKKQSITFRESSENLFLKVIGKTETETETNQNSVRDLDNFFKQKNIESKKYFFFFQLFSHLYTIFWNSFGFRNHIITFEYTSKILDQQKTKIINGELMQFDSKIQKFNPQKHKPLFKKVKIQENERVVVCIPIIYSIHSSKILRKALVIKC
ncbi:structural maintenance of chromosomes protein [Anaeramoeba flamelloides]|uniref:Structural maintenance of chromosomes protein n=1 Tax=Anaeramoeba flamelloides TaxID=1746091 RepID=A0ABQ8ZBX4_9EUKA|nr:structural maintenance of chromosomes protein [Anaeramoeba flamelloides]